MTAGYRFWKNSARIRVTTTKRKSSPKPMRVKKESIYKIRNLMSTSSKIVLITCPKSSVTGKRLEFILFFRKENPKVDLH